MFHCRRNTLTQEEDINMPGNAKDKRVHAVAKPVRASSRIPTDGDLTCSESQIEDILSEGESIKPMSKKDKGLHPKRQPKSLQ